VTVENIYLIVALLVLLLFVAMFALGQRFKKNTKPSPLAALSAVLVVAGIFFGNSPLLGCTLFGFGIVLAVSDIVVKARRGGSRGKEKKHMQQAEKRK